MRPPTTPRRARVARLALAGAAATAAYLGLAGDAAGAASTIKASFRAGVLTIDGTSRSDTITVSRTADGRLLVNEGTVVITGPTPTLITTDLVSIDGLAGADRLTISGAPMPNSELIGGTGADILTGANRPDRLSGGPGADTLAGRRGEDEIEGGTEDDTFTWAAGDDVDHIDGGAGTDVTRVVGTTDPETFLVSRGVGERMQVFRTRGGVFEFVTMDVVERLTLAAGGGDDDVTLRGVGAVAEGAHRIDLDLSGEVAGQSDGAHDTVEVGGTTIADAIRVRSAAPNVTPTADGLDLRIAGADAADTLAIDAKQGGDTVDLTGLAGQVATSIHGDDGDDRITGRAGPDEILGELGDDVIAGGDGADRISGGDGRDTIQTGAGDDLVSWIPGDDDDRVDDSGGRDRLQVLGADGAESFDLAKSAGRLLIARDIANVRLDTAGVEEIDLLVAGGADRVTVGDLAGLGVARVDVDLNASAGVDQAADEIVHLGTSGTDSQLLTGQAGGAYNLTGNGVQLEVIGSEPARDTVSLRAQSGNDSARTSGTVPAKVTIDGGAGRDAIGGSPGADVLLGGADDDVITSAGSAGTDLVDGGSGADRFVHTGTGSRELFTVARTGTGSKVSRDLGGTSTLLTVEAVEVRTGRGQDVVRIYPLAGSATTKVTAQLEGTTGTGAGDREADRIEVIGSADADRPRLIGGSGTADLSGLAAPVSLRGLDPTDVLSLALGLGADALDGARVPAGVLKLTADLGGGHDTAIGTKGDDTISGGAGNDTISGGAGNDTIDGALGRDTVDGGTGRDVVTGAEVVTNVP